MGAWDWLRTAWQTLLPVSPKDGPQVPAKGRWGSVADPSFTEMEEIRRQVAADLEREELSRQDLSVLIKKFDGDLAAALRIKELPETRCLIRLAFFWK